MKKKEISEFLHSILTVRDCSVPKGTFNNYVDKKKVVSDDRKEQLLLIISTYRTKCKQKGGEDVLKIPKNLLLFFVTEEILYSFKNRGTMAHYCTHLC